MTSAPAMRLASGRFAPSSSATFIWAPPGCQATPLLDLPKAHSSDNFHQVTLKVNRHLNTARARMGLLYSSSWAYLKQKVKSALSYAIAFEVAVSRKPNAAATTAWCAATLTVLKCATSTACLTAMTATG